MTRPRLRSSDQPLPVRLVLGLYELCASLRLAVVLIGTYAIVLAWATFVESYYGHKSRAAHYGIYGAWWFLGLNALLGLNVLCAALIRFPWKKRHTGFLITHAGILVLLFGCLLTYRRGINASLPIYEGASEWRALQDSQHLRLTIEPLDPKATSKKAGGETPPGSSDNNSRPEAIVIPFVAGPFNWDDYNRMFPFPWCLARRDQGVIYDQDGIKLDALDYYSDSKRIPVPQLTLRVNSGSSRGRVLTDAPGESVQLAVTPMRDPHGPGRRDLTTAERLVFWMAGSQAETDAFRDSSPEGPLGPRGQIVLHADARKFHIPVDRLQKQPREPLGDTGLEVELVQFIPQLLGLQLQIHHRDDPPQRMILLADFPELNRHDYHNGVFGSYWLDPDELSEEGEDQPADTRVLRNAQRPRIDILQSADQKLYYRTWQAPEVHETAQLPADGTEVTALGGRASPLTIYVEEFIPSEKPEMKLLSVEFDRDLSPALKQRQVRLRLSLDGTSEEFWLAGLPLGVPDASEFPSAYRRVVRGKNRRVAVTMPRDAVDIGFRVFLHKFDLRRDPGSRIASHYSSLVDFRDRQDDQKCLEKEVLITMNVPANFSDPSTGRSYRLYQSGYLPTPLKPGNPEFERLVAGREMREQLNRSDLSVNYDPGRGVKYVGSLMICVGIGIMFYMRTYFFRGPRQTAQG